MTDDETLFRAPRLTRLEIQGFKSFFNRTVFAFEPGITAIVGPNGSGKSNVADAVRWVLGEQGQSALRARKTEDVIFGGGQGRAPAGMAEATLTFDNSERWLPIEFGEVSVTRRAFRGGENQYLINGRRVRLRDVALLTAGLGQSHVVVGQGLVDAALSLRAEDRRGLFEHAADLIGLRLKVAEAERNLAETDANTVRLNDLLTEVEPRLRSLERAARQAKEWQGLRDRLRDLQGAHFRGALEAAAAQRESAFCAARATETACVAAQAEAERLTGAAAEATTRLSAAQARLAQHDQHRAALEDRLRRQTHERDLSAARIESLARRRADMDDARQGLDERVASVAADLARLHVDLRELERTTTEAREAGARHNREVARCRASRRAVETRHATALSNLTTSERQESELLRQRAVLLEREESLGADQGRLHAAFVEREQQIASLNTDLASVNSSVAADTEREAVVHRQLGELAASLEAATVKLTAARRETELLRQRLGEAATRLDVLRRLQESGAGLHAGVREVQAAARDGRLQGVRGTVSELLTVPQDLEVAIEVALGSRLQDVVVTSWSDAEAAIEHLKRTGAGRATFQPLDTVRAGRAGSLAPEVRRHKGIHGIAADLVSAPVEMNPVVSALLSRTLVADDLATAREALAVLQPGWSVVTVGGDIARAGGSVTGGSNSRESGTLSRERELRELPTAVAALEHDLAAARGRTVEADAETRENLEAQRAAEGKLATVRAAAAERRQQGERLTVLLTHLRAEQERAERRREELDQELERTTASLSKLEDDAARLAAARIVAEIARDEAAVELAQLSSATVDLERAAADEGRRLAGLEERLRGERRREASLRAQERALAEELALRSERTVMLDRERDALATDHAHLTIEVAAIANELASVAAERTPLELASTSAGDDANRLDDALRGARADLIERERERDRTGFALERAHQEWENVRRRIRDELEVDNPDEVLSWDSAARAMTPTGRENEIARLRERLRRVGYVGEDAVADYEREAAQQAFLREQLADVEGAATSLRDLLADLRRTMRARFDETFARVAEAFAAAFATLFGGGTAQLVLTSGENGAEPGIDIIAQPPGKRLQSLALLSGGERALTAAALLFAILHVNPVPFCLLDEVDAALDEANVIRFRERLQELAARTQVIVVTHNRGTIEIADTLYGVSMAADGVSQVLSLRLTEALPAD